MRYASNSIQPIDSLRLLYGTTRRLMAKDAAGQAQNPSSVSLEALCVALESDNTTVRVGLSVLERASLLKR